jgi:hypothetical protein
VKRTGNIANLLLTALDAAVRSRPVRRRLARTRSVLACVVVCSAMISGLVGCSQSDVASAKSRGDSKWRRSDDPGIGRSRGCAEGAVAEAEHLTGTVVSAPGALARAVHYHTRQTAVGGRK